VRYSISSKDGEHDPPDHKGYAMSSVWEQKTLRQFNEEDSQQRWFTLSDEQALTSTAITSIGGKELPWIARYAYLG
jgi:hypothetical protein